MLKTTISQLKTLSSPVGLGGEKLWLCPSLSKNGDTGQAFDLSGNVNNGAYNGGMGTVVDTAVGGQRAYLLDDVDDYVEVLDDDVQDLPGDFTISFWWNRNGLGGGPVLTKGQFNGGSGDWMIEMGGGNKYVFYINGTLLATWGTSVFSSYAWNHLTITRSGADLTLYMNGVQDGTGTSSANLTSTRPFRIGAQSTSTYGGGLGDDIRVFKRVLTLSEIKHLSTARGIQGSGKTRLKAGYEPASVSALIPRTRTLLGIGS
jgi:hypothetical protein